MTAPISTSNTKKLNNMNRAADNVQLGTMIQNMGILSTGSLSVSAAQMNASLVVIPTGLASVGGMIVAGTRSGSGLTINAVAGSVAGTIVVQKATNVTGSALTTGDVITYVAIQ